MVDRKFAAKILGIFYDQWFKNYIIGIQHRNVDTIVEGNKNEIVKMVELLESKGMVWLDNGWYKITSFGIETYEEALPPSAISKRITERKRIMEFLKELYDKDAKADTDSTTLINSLQIEDVEELRGQIKYLDDIGLVKYQPFSGGFFLVRLTAEGALRFESDEIDNSLPMTNAYTILFKLENHLRKFIEKQLTNSFGADWWEKGISKTLRDKVDGMKSHESQFPWVISITKSDMEYLEFPDLSRVITNQWNIFKPIFHDSQKIELRLNEIEAIRNAIAHTRTLSQDSINRLEQYNNDILNLTK